MFSIVVSTRRPFKDLEPLFKISNKETEIIIIDSNYNDETKEQLGKVEHDFHKVTYAPVYLKPQYKRDFCIGINTGIAYAENDWIIKLDDSTELKPDFFERLKEATTEEDYKIVIRPVKLEEWTHMHTRWEPHHLCRHIPDRYIVLGREGLADMMFSTLDQAVFHMKGICAINGYDDRYDIGHGYDDNDIFQRFLSAGYPIIMDQQLMTFQFDHTVKRDTIDYLMILYQFNLLEIINGRYWAFNPYAIADLHAELLEKKSEYVI
jgi:glycosyltransferase involved in cell wall biosynthesis